MLGALVQDWITLQGAANTSIAQAASDYIDSTFLQDMSFWLDVGTVTGSPAPSIFFETAPGKEETLFLPMVLGTVMSTTASPINVYSANALVTPARYVRWRVSSTVAWSATFRIFAALNPVGA